MIAAAADRLGLGNGSGGNGGDNKDGDGDVGMGEGGERGGGGGQEQQEEQEEAIARYLGNRLRLRSRYPRREFGGATSMQSGQASSAEGAAAAGYPWTMALGEAGIKGGEALVCVCVEE